MISQGSVSPSTSQSQLDAMTVKDQQNATIMIHEFLENTVRTPTNAEPIPSELRRVQVPHDE